MPGGLRFGAENDHSSDRERIFRFAGVCLPANHGKNNDQNTRPREVFMSYFPFLADENGNATLRTIKDSFGFVPNFYRAQTMRPDLIDAEAQLVDALLVKDGALTRQQKEYIF